MADFFLHPEKIAGDYYLAPLNAPVVGTASPIGVAASFSIGTVVLRAGSNILPLGVVSQFSVGVAVAAGSSGGAMPAGVIALFNVGQAVANGGGIAPGPDLRPISIAQFRLDFPEFGDPTKYTDAQIRVQLVAASMVLGELQWGEMWGYGVELRTAHFLTIRARNLAAAAAGGAGGAVSGLLTSKAVDKVSAGYDVGATTYEGAGFWNTSSYGIEFWQLLMMFGAGPIQL